MGDNSRGKYSCAYRDRQHFYKSLLIDKKTQSKWLPDFLKHPIYHFLISLPQHLPLTRCGLVA